jgi:hypothetical protein
MSDQQLSATQWRILGLLFSCSNGCTAEMLSLHHLFVHDDLMALGRSGLISMRPTLVNNQHATVHFKISDLGRKRVVPNRKRSSQVWRS